MTNAARVHFNTTVQEADPLVADALASERARQQNQIELIASENIVSRAVLDALGHEITNKTLEGYPGNRFHGGGQFVDIAEQAAIDRAKQLFNCGYANVQPHSGTQANLAVFFLLLKPGEKVLSLDLAAGGHLSHGMKANLSGRWFDANNYSVNPQNEVIDLDEMERIAEEIHPKLLITGGSAYPRELDFERMSKIARKVGAHFLVDMAHIAGLVAGGVHPSPFPHADIVTCTTTKTLRGPRGGLILTNNEEWYKKLQAAVFPGVQGSLHSNVLAAKAICLGEALRDDFQALRPARSLKTRRCSPETLCPIGGVRIVSGWHRHPHRPAGSVEQGTAWKTGRDVARQGEHHIQQEPHPRRQSPSSGVGGHAPWFVRCDDTRPEGGGIPRSRPCHRGSHRRRNRGQDRRDRRNRQGEDR